MAFEGSSGQAFQDRKGFMLRMRPHARRIYDRIFPGCAVEDLRTEGLGAHILDQHFAIDSLIRLPDGSFFTLQEKYREYENLYFGDFTQEYLNAAGTTYESPGEWFKLAAQLYFYGWANRDQTDFQEWILLDIVKYKLLVMKSGGITVIGKRQQNKRHGSAVFYGLRLTDIALAFVDSQLSKRRQREIEQYLLAKSQPAQQNMF